jgi:hypothetical protein
MIIAKSEGRAGNQLFVVAALLKLKRARERLVLHRFDDFDSLMAASSPEIRHLRFPRVPRVRWWFLLESTLRTLAAFRITRTVRMADGGDQLEMSRGLVPLALFDAGFCQDERLVDTAQIREFWRTKTEVENAWLSSLNLTPETLEGRMSCFVHVRRGDYLYWPSPEFPAALDADWYRTQMLKAKARSDIPVRFLIFSDDPDFCRNAFGDDPDIVIVDAPSDLSFLAMSRCQAGILSASTFSWWAAKLASVDQPGPFIAPRYWFGSGTKQWLGSPTPVDGFLEWA